MVWQRTTLPNSAQAESSLFCRHSKIKQRISHAFDPKVPSRPDERAMMMQVHSAVIHGMFYSSAYRRVSRIYWTLTVSVTVQTANGYVAKRSEAERTIYRRRSRHTPVMNSLRPLRRSLRRRRDDHERSVARELVLYVSRVIRAVLRLDTIVPFDKKT